MPSLTARALQAYTRKNIKRIDIAPEKATRHFRRCFNTNVFPVLLPKGVSLMERTVAGVTGSYLATAQPSMTVLYCHGGGMVAGIPETYHNFCSRLARQLDAEVYIPDYRLAPEHPFPAGLNDCFAVYEQLLNDGVKPENLVIAGDSAGGNFTLALLHQIKDSGLPMPRCAVALSPACDVTYTSGGLERNDKSDAILSAAMIKGVARDYIQSHPADDPYASPLYGNFKNYPPMMLLGSTTECLYDDMEALGQKALDQGCHVEFVRRDDLVHVWPIFIPLLPEARQDLKKIVSFIHRSKSLKTA